MLKRIAQVFSVSTDYLLGLEDCEHIDVSGLPPEVVTHIRQLTEDLRIAYGK